MKPKAKKYRVAHQQSGRQAAPQPHPASIQPTVSVTKAPAQTANANSQAAAPRTAIGSMENLTPRQLRIARRVASKHGLSPATDLDAVRMLREKGIDPFLNNSMVDLAVGNTDGGGELAEGEIKLPQRHSGKDNLPSADVLSTDKRMAEIAKIQRDIARRRRIKMMLLTARLSIFVFLPTLIAGYYFYAVATPMYTSNTEFLILNAEGGGAGAGGGLGGLMPAQFATGQDSIATQSYLESKDAMLRLDKDLGFRAAFSNDNIDPIQRLDENATVETAYKLYKRYVKLGYDQTEGVIKMEVSSADPEMSQKFSGALIEYAEDMVDQLSREKRTDAMENAIKNLEDAKKERRAAQERLVALQEGSLLDPEGEIANIRALIGSVEAQLQEKELALQVQLNNSRPNKARVDALRAEIDVLKAEQSKQKARLTDAQTGAQSLAAQTAEIRMAEADTVTADMILQGALEARRQTEIEANRQVRYLTVSVAPLVSDSPSYPKAFENTLLAFLIFAGIYLFISLTASVLRDQVSS